MRLATVFFAGIAFSAPAVVSGEETPAGPRLQSEGIAIQFEPSEAGLGVSAIEHKSGGGAPEPFVKEPPASALIWRLVLRGPSEKA